MNPGKTTVVCPDGQVRRPDAESDYDARIIAEILTEQKMACPDPMTGLPTTCPGGKHDVQ